MQRGKTKSPQRGLRTLALGLGVAAAVSIGLTAARANAQPPSEDDVAKARDLYMEAEELAKAGEWQKAADIYEQAYYLTPSKHGFAYKVGTAAWEAGDCVRAEKYLAHYRTYGEADKHPEFMTEADRILNQIEFKGCAEPPPEPDETEASKRGCRVADESPFAPAVFVLSIVALSRRRS